VDTSPVAAAVRRPVAAFAVATAALLLWSYSNHFQNGFHFDDSHAIVDNVSVRDLSSIPRYFSDATTFSVLPLNQSYRPILQTTLAIDYWIGGGYRPLVFHIDTFLWFVLLIVAMAALFRALTGNAWIAAIAVALYAVHPVCAETINYVIQRGDLLSTLGVVLALLIYVRRPSWRSRGVYLVPFVLGALAKPPALVFPVLLAAYVAIFERRSRLPRHSGGRATTGVLRAIAPSLVVAAAMGWWLAHKTPPTAVTGAADPARYLLTQPFVATRYLASFFAPIDLSADNDWPLVNGAADPRTIAGFVFIAAIAWTAWRIRGHAALKPAAFGLTWFIVALLPTSMTPLAEVANDHRMFFPFVGLTLAVTAGAGWALSRVLAPDRRPIIAALLVGVALIAGAEGVRARNEVWQTEQTLWRDVTEKSPDNGRGWMNYGVAQMARGDVAGAIASFQAALPLTPNYHLLHVNLGVAYGSAGRATEAEQRFLKAIEIEPNDWRSHLYFARWLAGVGRGAEALAHAELSRELNPADPQAAATAAPLAPLATTPEFFLARSLAEYQMGRYRDSIASAQRAVALRSGYAEAFNNIAAGHIALGEWDAGIAAAEEALRLNPTLAIARNNLAYARAQKAAGARAPHPR